MKANSSKFNSLNAKELNNIYSDKSYITLKGQMGHFNNNIYKKTYNIHL